MYQSGVSGNNGSLSRSLSLSGNDCRSSSTSLSCRGGDWGYEGGLLRKMSSASLRSDCLMARVSRYEGMGIKSGSGEEETGPEGITVPLVM